MKTIARANRKAKIRKLLQYGPHSLTEIAMECRCAPSTARKDLDEMILAGEVVRDKRRTGYPQYELP